MEERLARDQEDSDAAYWWSLLYFGELLTKTVAAGLVAAIGDDRDRLRYSQAHRLVRADGIGEWAQAIDDVLTGPPAQYFLPGASSAVEATRQKIDQNAWQAEAVGALCEVVRLFDPTCEKPPTKPALRLWFSLFARLRNKTRGHGAPLGGTLSAACPQLRTSIDLLAKNHPLLSLPWAHLHQSLSGKYRVSYLTTQRSEAFERLKKEKSDPLPDGVYIDFGRPTRAELVITDADLTDIYCPNGNFRPPKLELISYITGATQTGDATAYLASPKDLPAAETEGLGTLAVQGQCFGNLPRAPQGYVARPALEEQLEQALLSERRPVITLHGPGGIGKTSLALTVLHKIASLRRFEVIVWFSARDVELLPEGPKPVRPKILAEKDIARDYASLLSPSQAKQPKFDAVSWLAEELANASAGATLFVFDNFETVTSPDELFVWLNIASAHPTRFSSLRVYELSTATSKSLCPAWKMQKAGNLFNRLPAP